MEKPQLFENRGNTIFNNYGQTKELIIYKNSFNVPTGCPVQTDIDRSRKFFYNSNGHLQPKTQTEAILEDLQNSLFDSRKRSLDKLYSYTLCNKWKYFITLTFKQTENLNRHNLDQVNHAWKMFKQKIQRQFPDITILLVPEGHPTSGAIHFHGLLGNCNLEQYLTPAINNDPNSPYYKQQIQTEYGNLIWNFTHSFYKYGFSTVAKITPDTPQLQIANYIAKYISKDLETTNVRYNKKSYYHTRNLLSKEKTVLYLEDSDINELLATTDFQKTKETDKFIVYKLEQNNEPITKPI